jgi:uncharacterized membrane protein YdjX (TVP38/TMEM64 family)
VLKQVQTTAKTEKGELPSRNGETADRAHDRKSASLKPLLQRLEAAAIFIGSCALAFYVVRERAFVTHELSILGFWSYPIAVLLMAVVASAPFSVTDALAVMNGVIFGPVGGTIVNALGILAAGVLGYRVALRTSALLELDRQVERLPGWVRRFQVGSFPFLVAVRIIPGVGGTIATQTAAAMRVPLWIHVAAMGAIAIPICTVLAIGGDSLAGFVEHRFTEPVGRYMRAHHPHFSHMHLPFQHGVHHPTEGSSQ